MFKIILTLLIGLGIGGAAGFFVGVDQTEKTQQEILKTQQASWAKQLKECNEVKEQKAKLEEENKVISADLKLNESRSCFVSSAPLLAPEFVPPDLETFASDGKGDVVVNWTPVKGAKKYIVTVEDQEGKIVNTTEVEGEPNMTLNRITQGGRPSAADYFVRIATVNGLDQAGDPGPRKPVHFLAPPPKVSANAIPKKLPKAPMKAPLKAHGKKH